LRGVVDRSPGISSNAVIEVELKARERWVASGFTSKDRHATA
jgi:hypothetical protein